MDMSEQEKPTTTHGAKNSWRGKDGVKRVVSVARSSANTYLLVIGSFWDGDDKPPMTTTLHLGAESYIVLTNLLIEFALERDRFRVAVERERIVAEEQAQNVTAVAANPDKGLV